MDKYMYPSLKARIQAEYKIYLLAFLFIAIADKIGQIKSPSVSAPLFSSLFSIPLSLAFSPARRSQRL